VGRTLGRRVGTPLLVVVVVAVIVLFVIIIVTAVLVSVSVVGEFYSRLQWIWQ
jgi:hypothetical protein